MTPKRWIAPLERGRIRLRLLEEADLPMTLAWRNQEHIRKWFFYSDVLAPEQHRAWYEKYRLRDDDFVFIIEETQTLQKPVGQVALYNIDWAARRGEFGRLLIGEPEAVGQGLAFNATHLLVNTALTTWGLREVFLEVYAHNTAALTIYRRCGFHVTHERIGVLTMSILRTEPAAEEEA